MVVPRVYKVKVTVTGIRGKHKCWQGHEVGDSWLFDDNETRANFCQTAFYAVYPAIAFFRQGGRNWWATDETANVINVSCPDPEVLVQYEVRRLPD